jgi:hypothetical protein
MTNSSSWYRWPIEIDGLPFLKMMDLSMPMLNNNRVKHFHGFINLSIWGVFRQQKSGLGFWSQQIPGVWRRNPDDHETQRWIVLES